MAATVYAGEWNRTTKAFTATALQAAEPTALLNAGVWMLALSDEPFRQSRKGEESKWRPTGIAPASSACKAGALLLSYGPR